MGIYPLVLIMLCHLILDVCALFILYVDVSIIADVDIVPIGINATQTSLVV